LRQRFKDDEFRVNFNTGVAGRRGTGRQRERLGRPD
jgi:hypothetical protein